MPILPHINRPSIIQGIHKCEDDITIIYYEIVKANAKISKFEYNSPKFLEYQKKILFNMKALYNNADGRVHHQSSGRPMKSLGERLCSKDGFFRNNLLGKRSDQTGRAVASPLVVGSCSQVGIPKSIADILTRVYECTLGNIVELQQMCDDNLVARVERCIKQVWYEYGVAKFVVKKQTKLRRGDLICRKTIEGSMTPFEQVKVTTGREILQPGDVIKRGGVTIETSVETRRSFKILIGDKVSRYLQNGDLVLINRQPTLHTGSIIALEAVIHDGYTIKVPLSCTPRLNMDFDGDEANIHAFQSDMALTELKNRATVAATLISPSTGKPMITLVQDTVLAMYLMTRKSCLIDDELITVNVDRVNKIRLDLNMVCSNDTIALLSSCLPEITCGNDKYKIIRGVWVEGTCDKKITVDIIEQTIKQVGNEACVDMISALSTTCIEWLSMVGFTIDMNDTRPFTRAHVNASSEHMFETGLDTNSVRNALHAEALERQSNILACVNSGAKGTSLNIGQIIASLGQQYCNDGILKANMSMRRVFAGDALNCAGPFENAKKFGYITSSFASGLDRREFFSHAIPTRQTVVDGAVLVPSAGYLAHKITRIANDGILSRFNNGFQVVDNKRTIDLVYNNGQDPNTTKKKSLY
jgi:DNA-directed RNA polymerase subunit A'